MNGKDRSRFAMKTLFISGIKGCNIFQLLQRAWWWWWRCGGVFSYCIPWMGKYCLTTSTSPTPQLTDGCLPVNQPYRAVSLNPSCFQSPSFCKYSFVYSVPCILRTLSQYLLHAVYVRVQGPDVLVAYPFTRGHTNS